MRLRSFSAPGRAMLAAAGLALAGTALAACGDDDAAGSPDAAHNSADVEFAQQMIPHHAQAIEMSEMVADRSDNPEIRALAEDIEAAQQPEIDQMSQLLSDWGEDVPDSDAGGGHGGHGPSGDMAGMMSDEDMAALHGASGPGFDEMWLTMMIEHHEGAIEMSETVLAEGTDPEVRQLAEEIIEAQRAEIEEMRGLLGGEASARGAGDGHTHGDDVDSEAFGHIHGLGVAGDELFVATHYGLFTVSADGAAQVSEDDHDFMGFTVADEGAFLASGHPGAGSSGLPPNLGLLESTDGGRTWDEVSLLGEVDFHALDAKHGSVYGVDSATGRLMASNDLTTWSDFDHVPMADVTISPDDPATVVVTTEAGPQLTDNGGADLTVLENAPLLVFVDWPRPDELYGVGVDGTVHRSEDGGSTWAAGATLGAQPQALTVGPDGAVYAALDGSIVVSTDGGASFSDLLTWR